MEEGSVNLCKAIIIGGSAGSLEVLMTVLPRIHKPLNLAIVIVVHRKQGTDSILTQLLQSRTEIPILDIEEKQPISSGSIYIAPSDYHLLIEKDFTFSLDYSEKVNYSRPAIDVTFQTAADAYKKNLACILLSGSNADGVNGLIVAKRVGAQVAVQDPATAQVAYMPAQAILKAGISHVLNASGIVDYINRLSSLSH